MPWARPERRQDDDSAARTAKALAIWRSCVPINGTVAERYLRQRGIAIPVPATLRYHAGLRHEPTGLTFPVLVAAVQAPDRRVVAIHRTFLTPDGRKAQVSTPKMALGPIGLGAVRLGPAGTVLGLAEGTETALSAMQIYDVTVWAALGSRLAQVELPAEVIEVQIFADNQAPGREAASKALERFARDGRRVVIRYPQGGHADFNDMLKAEVAA